VGWENHCLLTAGTGAQHGCTLPRGGRARVDSGSSVALVCGVVDGFHRGGGEARAGYLHEVAQPTDPQVSNLGA
jgi:hypothetical protein